MEKKKTARNKKGTKEDLASNVFVNWMLPLDGRWNNINSQNDEQNRQRERWDLHPYFVIFYYIFCK